MGGVITTMRYGQCRFPTTAQPIEVDSMAGRHHLFCGEPVQTGSAYCTGHHSRCYRGTGTPWQKVADMIRWNEEHG